MADNDKGPSIDADTFFRRLARVQAAWEVCDLVCAGRLRFRGGVVWVARLQTQNT